MAGGANIRNENANAAYTLNFSAANFNVTAGLSTPNTTRTLTFGGINTGNNTVAGIIINNNASAAIAVAKADAGTWILSGANLYTGGTTISGGTLQFAKINAMPATGTVTVGSGTTLAVNAGGTGEFTSATSGNGSIGGLLSGVGGQGTSVIYTGNVSLGIDTANASGGTMTYAGNMVNVGTTLALRKLGANTLVLDGNNTYTGSTTVSEGTLQLGNGGTTGLLSTSSSIINNGTLAFNRSSAVTQGTHFGLISGTGAVTTIGTGTLTLGGDNTYSGTTTVATGGRLDVAVSANALGSTAAGTIVNSGGQLRLQNVTIGAEALTISGTGQGGTGGAIRGGSGSSTYGGKVTLAANATVFTGDPAVLTFDVASGDAFDLGSNTLTFDGAGTHQVNDGIAGTGGLIKTGSGLLAVSGTSSYNGTTTVSNGTLRAGAAAGGRAFGNLSAVTLAASPANNTALDLNNFNQTIGSLAGGTTGGITSGVVLGSGTLTTGGDNTSTSFAGVISGTGGLTKTGSGTMTLAAANNYSGATAVNNGLLKILSGGSISSSSTTVNNGGALDVGGTAGSVQVNSGGLLKGSGSAGAVTLQSGSLLNPGNSPGTLTAASAIISGGSTYNWEISGLTGTAGTTWDLFSVGGLLNMSGVTSANKWNLVVTGDSGFAGWTDTNSYSYVFAQAASVSGFSSTVGTDVTSLFNITTSGIASNPNASFNVNGDFKVVVGSSNGSTTLNLMAVPEPSTGSMLGLGLAGLVATRLLRRKSS
jgi:autotransporter-associated beta strand protein